VHSLLLGKDQHRRDTPLSRTVYGHWCASERVRGVTSVTKARQDRWHYCTASHHVRWRGFHLLCPNWHRYELLQRGNSAALESPLPCVISGTDLTAARPSSLSLWSTSHPPITTGTQSKCLSQAPDGLQFILIVSYRNRDQLLRLSWNSCRRGGQGVSTSGQNPPTSLLHACSLSLGKPVCDMMRRVDGYCNRLRPVYVSSGSHRCGEQISLVTCSTLI
jgi:hypothetical protein